MTTSSGLVSWKRVTRRYVVPVRGRSRIQRSQEEQLDEANSDEEGGDDDDPEDDRSLPSVDDFDGA